MKKPNLNEFYKYRYAGHIWTEGYYCRLTNYIQPKDIKRSELCVGDILYIRKGRNIHEYLMVDSMSGSRWRWDEPPSELNMYDIKIELVPLKFSNSLFSKYTIEFSSTQNDCLRIDKLKPLEDLTFLMEKLGCKEPNYLNVSNYPTDR